jgi:hypothetical protein
MAEKPWFHSADSTQIHIGLRVTAPLVMRSSHDLTAILHAINGSAASFHLIAYSHSVKWDISSATTCISQNRILIYLSSSAS